jgi:hypothetical protein
MREAVLPIRLVSSLFSSSPKRAAEEIVRLATAPEYETTHGKFLRHGKEIPVPAYASDSAVQQRLWDVSEQLSELSIAKGELPINDPHLSDSHPIK